MRSIAKFKLVHERPPDGIFEAVRAVLEHWQEGKIGEDGHGGHVIKRDGRAVILKVAGEDGDDGRLFTLALSERVDGGTLSTQVRLLESGGRVHFVCELGVRSAGVSRPMLALRAPRFVQQVVAAGPSWQVEVGRDRIFAESFDVKAADAATFEALIASPERALPVVAISTLNGVPEFPDLARRLASRVTALAHICILNEEPGWTISRRLGQQWSCYNGAVRLYWPGSVGTGNPFRHPLWTVEPLLKKHGSAAAAQDWLERKLTNRIIEASSYLSDDPEFEDFEEGQSRKRIQAAIATAEHNSDYRKLADAYAQENDGLRDRLSRLQVRLENAEAELVGLRQRYHAGEVEDEADEAATEAPPANVREAVDRAKAACGKSVAFPDNLHKQLNTLSDIAGPPEKVLNYLETLRDLAEALQSPKGLGKAIPIWLRDKNVECSGESDTKKKNRSEQQQRTFPVAGQQVYCEYHLKPTDGTSPDRCVRIYFAVEREAPFVRVGYIGRHF